MVNQSATRPGGVMTIGDEQAKKRGSGVAGSRVPRGGKTSEAAAKPPGTTTSTTTLKWIMILPALAIAIFAGVAASGRFNILNCLDSNVEIHTTALAFYATMFCLSPMPGFLLNDRENRAEVVPLGNSSFTFAETGNIEDTYVVRMSKLSVGTELVGTECPSREGGLAQRVVKELMRRDVVVVCDHVNELRCDVPTSSWERVSRQSEFHSGRTLAHPTTHTHHITPTTRRRVSMRFSTSSTKPPI